MHVHPMKSGSANHYERETFEADGTIVEVLHGVQLAHVRMADGTIKGLNRLTAGVEFKTIRAGMSVRCEVSDDFNRVLKAQLLAA